VRNKFEQWKQSSKQYDIRASSDILEKLVKNQLVNEATEMVFEMLSENIYPAIKIFKMYLRSLTEINDLKTLNKINEQLKPRLKNKVQFEKFFIQAHLNANLGKEYLDMFNKRVNSVNNESELKRFKMAVPRFGHLNLLNQYPDLLDKYTTIAERCVEKGIYSPINVLWLNKCLKENSVAAGEDIFQKYFINQTTPKFMGHFAERVLKQGNNEALLKQLAELKEQSGVVSIQENSIK